MPIEDKSDDDSVMPTLHSSVLQDELAYASETLIDDDTTLNVVMHTTRDEVTPPWPVPSPVAKGGGMGVGLAPQPITCKPATETSTTTNQFTTVLGDEGSSTRRDMTPGGQSRKETTGLTPLLSTRTINVATWNVRTMYETGKTAQVAAEMRNYQLALLGISETRWTQSGQKRLMTGELLLFSGHEEENSPHTQLRSRTHAVMTSTESADRMGSTRTMDHHINLQNQEEKD